jgi:hypothetical protein
MANSAPAEFLHQLFPPLPRSAALLEMCEHINAVEELPAWRKRRKLMTKLSVSFRVPTTQTGARILQENMAENLQRTINNFSDRLRLRSV